MNMISTILKQLPGLKSSADFDAAITDLETEHAAALAAVTDLEAGREAAIFNGGDLAALEGDILAAESRMKTLSIALAGARKRQTAAVEAETQAALEKKGATTRKLNAEVRADLAAFDTPAAAAVKLAERITERRREIAVLNAELRAGGRGDLVCVDPINDLAATVDRQVADPIRALVIPEYWPRRHPDGPALSRLSK